MAVVLISGSPSAQSRSMAVLAHISDLLGKSGIVTSSLAVRDFPAEDILHGRYDSESLKAAGKLIDAAHGIVIASPIYKGATAGVLKAFLDLLGQNAFEGKVVLPIAVGGSPTHLLAVDYSLKPVLAALGATHVLGTVYAIDKQIQIADTGQIDFDDDILLRLQNAAQKFIRVIPREGITSSGSVQRRSAVRLAVSRTNGLKESAS